MKISLIIVGAGGHGRSVAEAARLSGTYDIAGFVDDGIGSQTQIMGVPVIGSTNALADYLGLAALAVVAIGNNHAREGLHRQLRAAGFTLATVIHPGALVSPSAIVGPGCAVMAGAIVGTEATLGEGTIVNCGAVVDHHCLVEDFGHLGVNTSMAGGSVLGFRGWLQAGSSLGYGVRLRKDAVIAPGEGVSASHPA